MRQSEIKALSAKELEEKFSETKKYYATLKMNHVATPLENPLQLRSIRKTVARLATELTKRKSQNPELLNDGK